MDMLTSQVGTSVVMFGVHRGGSSITCRLLQVLLAATGYSIVDEGERYYNAGYVTDDIPQAFFSGLARLGTMYGPFRCYPLTARLANLSALTRILVIRDPRDCLVSSYFAQHGPHDRADLRRAHLRLPTQLDCGETIDDFCVRNADTVRRDFDALRLLCLHYPDTLVFRYEDIYRDPAAWLRTVVARLNLHPPPGGLDQALMEAVFDPPAEDAGRHHRQGRPGDHQRKLSRQTAIYLAELFAPLLTFFGYGGEFVVPEAAPKRGDRSDIIGDSSDDVPALKRIIIELQRENGYRIGEIADLRHAVAALRQQDATASVSNDP